MSLKNELQELLQKYSLPVPDYQREDSTGPSHSPRFKYRVTVIWKDEQVLVERAEGKRVKEAEQNAAKVMLQRIKNMDSEIKWSAGASPPLLSGPPLSSVKNELQTLLQRQGLPLPVYTFLPTQGPAHKSAFTAKLEIRSTSETLLWVGYGSGGTKKEAQVNAAQEALENMKTRLRDGTFYSHAAIKVSEQQVRSSSQSETVDTFTEETILAHLSKFSCSSTYADGEENTEVQGEGGPSQSVVLCMALAEGGGLEHPVVSHGQGDSKTAAQTEASLNLIQNISHLFPTALQ